MTDHPSALVSVPVDDLAQEIRRVDGNNDLGAGALAEALVPFLSAMLAAAPAAPQAAGVGEDEWSELERLADAATQGPWKACGTIYEHMNCEVRGGAKGEGQAIAQVWDGPNAFKDGQFIAAADPATIKRLIAALRAPSREPEGEAEKLHLKLLDTLKPFAEVAEKLKHCHVVEICEPTPENPSRNIIPMPREWFERAADDLEAIAIHLHGAGALSEGQASKLTCLDRVEVRKLADALATREEATVGAGEWTVGQRFPELNEHLTRMSLTGNTGSRTEWVAFRDCLRSALRARSSAPEAREDASPVSWMTTTEIHGWLLPHLKHMISFNTFHDVVVKALRHTHPAAPSADKLRTAVEDIAAERQRQIESEKRSESSDDLYVEGELARGAVAYALSGSGFDHAAAREMWPARWHYSWWKPTTPRRDLVKAGALIVAEIERRDRQALSTPDALKGDAK